MTAVRGARWAGFALLLLLAAPALGLVAGTSPADLAHALSLPSTHDALRLSLRTTSASLAVTVALGTPLAWWLSRGGGTAARLARGMVELPIVLPPAVLGVAMLETFGRGTLGPALAAVGLSLPFSSEGVVLAQIVEGAPLFVLTAAAAFAAVDDDHLIVARTLGAGPARAWATVALPAAAGGMATGAALAWARSLGEFGATLMFAGNLQGRTQTLPLAIYGALERDLAQARSLSVLLIGAAVVLLVGLRAGGAWRAR